MTAARDRGNKMVAKVVPAAVFILSTIPSINSPAVITPVPDEPVIPPNTPEPKPRNIVLISGAFLFLSPAMLPIKKHRL